MASTAELMGLGLPGQLADVLGDNQDLPATTNFTTLIGTATTNVINSSTTAKSTCIQGGTGTQSVSGGAFIDVFGLTSSEPGGVAVTLGNVAGSRLVNWLRSSTSYASYLDTTGQEVWRVQNSGKMKVATTVTPALTTGNQTISKPTGRVNFAAGASSLTVTNTLVSATSLIIASVNTADATALIKNVVPGAGSFVINLNANATAETAVSFIVFND
jgi:hypothetical protein